MNSYHKLFTAEDSAVVFIDHQPQMTFGVANIDRASLINNVTLLAKVAKEKITDSDKLRKKYDDEEQLSLFRDVIGIHERKGLGMKETV